MGLTGEQGSPGKTGKYGERGKKGPIGIGGPMGGQGEKGQKGEKGQRVQWKSSNKGGNGKNVTLNPKPSNVTKNPGPVRTYSKVEQDGFTRINKPKNNLPKGTIVGIFTGV